MEWWQKEGVKPLVKFDEDGQTRKQIFARKYRGEWEYAIVTFPDGDPEPISGVRLWKGGAEQITLE